MPALVTMTNTTPSQMGDRRNPTFGMRRAFGPSRRAGATFRPDGVLTATSLSACGVTDKVNG